MMLIVLDRYPTIAAKKLIAIAPRQFIFKQLIELGQLICSAGISNVYKPINRGKEIQNWIMRNPCWTCVFFLHLLLFCKDNINMTIESRQKLDDIYFDLLCQVNKVKKYARNTSISTAIFRYKKDYTGSKHKTNKELYIIEAIREYENYLKWKFNNDNNKIKIELASKA